MKILIIGGGGREHALTWKLAEDSTKPIIFCAPGNAGTARIGKNVTIKANDIEGLLKWAKENQPDLTIVGPEAPLCAGLVDRFQENGLRVFGPCQKAAQIEGSKVFSKDVLVSADVPTGQAESFSNAENAKAYIRSARLPIVVKADGLAAGKGVIICTERSQADKAIEAVMIDKAFGAAGAKVLIEEYLEGEEVSIMALVDGEHAVLLPSSQDHKRIFDGDKGPNTGGMGAYSPAPMEDAEFRKIVLEHILNPTLAELRRRGIKYHGILYGGLIITSEGIKVLEFNCRFGDPESQVVLPRLDCNLLPILEACIDGTLDDKHISLRTERCVCVIIAAGGYPKSYHKGDIIKGLNEVEDMENVLVFHAGTKQVEKCIITDGGRILGVTALGADLASAASLAYKAVSEIRFNNMYFRRDIAAKGLKKLKQ